MKHQHQAAIDALLAERTRIIPLYDQCLDELGAAYKAAADFLAAQPVTPNSIPSPDFKNEQAVVKEVEFAAPPTRFHLEPDPTFGLGEFGEFATVTRVESPTPQPVEDDAYQRGFLEGQIHALEQALKFEDLAADMRLELLELKRRAKERA